jgi:photosystem II stability/assembly factor-like uncharacterized protein
MGRFRIATWRERRLLAVALCAMIGSATAAPGRWSSAGPYGGRVDSALASPLEPGVVYASAHRSVYRSTDSGLNWSLASAGLSTISVGDTVLAAHPAQAGTLALAGARGVFATVNSGRTWLRRDNGLPINSSFRTVDIDFAPSEPARLYLATADDGLFRTVNGGANWTAVGGVSLPSDLDRIAVDPANAQVVLAWARDRNDAVYPASLYRSSNGGVSFSAVTGPWDGGGPIDQPLSLLAFNGNTPGTVFLAGPFGNYRSLDGGASFTALPPLPITNTQRLQSLAFDPLVAGRVLFGTSDGVLLSTDNGAALVPRNGGLSVTAGDPASIGPVIIDPTNNNRWLAFSVSGEVFVTGNAGLNWTAASTGLRGTGIQTVAVHPTRPQRVFAGLRNLRTEATSPALYQSDDGAQSWLRFNSALLLDTVNAIAFDPGTVATPATTRIYAGGADFAPVGLLPTAYRGGVFRSVDGGLTWAPADTLVPAPVAGPAATGEVTSILVDPGSVAGGNAQVLYFAARGVVRCIGGVPTVEVARIWGSNNASASWAPRDGLPPGVCSPRTQYPLPLTLAIDGGVAGTIYAGTALAGYCADCGDPLPTQANGVFKSSDSGQNWSPASNGLPLMSGSGSTLDVVALASVPGQPGRLYAALNDPTVEDAPGRVFRTTDGGANWSPADAGIVGLRVRALRIDPGVPNRIYAAAAGIEVTPGGVYVSNDGGDSWASISIDLPVDSAQSLALSLPVAGPPTLHAGTDEGVWSLTRVPDGDLDGPPDATEDLAPNAGDGNNDGIADRLQTDVASFEIPASLLPLSQRGGGRQGTISNTELIIRGSSCQQVYDVAAIDPEGLPEDPDFEPSAGLMRFEFVDCPAATVRIAFHDETFGQEWRFRRYGPSSSANVLTLGWLGMGAAASRAGNVWTLEITDNSPGDLRREVGRILFVGGPVRLTPLFATGFE